MEYKIDKKHLASPELVKLFDKKVKEGKIHVIHEGGKANIPFLTARGKNLAEAWENSLIALWARGILVRTQYDFEEQKVSGILPPPSRDSRMSMVIDDPLSEPMIHRASPGGPVELEEYRQEVLDGIKDNWIRDPNNPKDKRWEYTYHERMFSYKVPGLEKIIDQFEQMAKNLAKSPITRRAQIVSWKVWEDNQVDDPACLQSLWGRILRDSAEFKMYSDEKGEAYLNLDLRFRSRDAYDAAFMNDFAFILLADRLAKRIGEIRGEEIKLARLIDTSNSYHIYGKRFDDFNDRFLSLLFSRKFEDPDSNGYGQTARTYRTTDEVVKIMSEEAKETIEKKVAEQNAKYSKGEGLTKESSKIIK